MELESESLASDEDESDRPDVATIFIMRGQLELSKIRSDKLELLYAQLLRLSDSIQKSMTVAALSLMPGCINLSSLNLRSTDIIRQELTSATNNQESIELLKELRDSIIRQVAGSLHGMSVQAVTGIQSVAKARAIQISKESLEEMKRKLETLTRVQMDEELQRLRKDMKRQQNLMALLDNTIQNIAEDGRKSVCDAAELVSGLDGAWEKIPALEIATVVRDLTVSPARDDLRVVDIRNFEEKVDTFATSCFQDAYRQYIEDALRQLEALRAKIMEDRDRNA